MKSKRLIFLIIILAAVLWEIFWLSFPGTRYLLNLTRQDPLFYSPAVDTNELRKMAERLILAGGLYLKERQEISDRGDSQSAPEEIEYLKKLIQTGFFPRDYLKTLPETFDETSVFLKKPNLRNAYLMLRADLQTAKAYQKNASELYELIAQAPAGSKEMSSVYLINTVSDYSAVLNDFSLIKENGGKLIKESRARILCLFSGICRGIEAGPPADLTKFRDDAVPASHDFKLLPEELISREKSIYGPFLIKTDCLAGGDYIPVYLRTTPYFIEPKQADEKYFVLPRDVSGVPENKILETLAGSGDKLSEHAEGKTFMCADLSYYGDLALLKFFREKFKERQILSQRDLAVLYDYLKSNGNVEGADDYILILENRIIDLPLMLGRISWDLAVSRLAMIRNPQYRPTAILDIIVRPDFSLTYNTFSRSTWRLPKKPQYFKRTAPLPSIYVTYSQLRKFYSDEEIRRSYNEDTGYAEKVKELFEELKSPR